MRKVLIITYYWPPAGGSGVQRWLKFTKYLRSFGWEPVIYTAANPEAPAMDEKLLAEVPEGVQVIRRKVWEPHNLFRKLTGRKGQTFGAGLASSGKAKSGFLNRLAIWVRGNLFIPDARMFWVRPSIRHLTKYLKQNPVDAIVSTGPPHSTHLIAKGVSHKLNIPWLADFRDPWTQIDFFHDFKPGALARKIHSQLEREVLTTAQTVVTVTNGWASDLSKLGGVKVEVVENGYDPDDFQADNIEAGFPLKGFALTHIGTLSPNRNCNLLWEVLGEMVKLNPDFSKELKLRFVGSVDASAHEGIEKNGLLSHTEFLGYVPHKEAVLAQLQSAVLVLLVNQSPNAMGIQTGKVFEYMAAGRPILAIGPKEGDTHRLMDETQSGLFVDFTSKEEIRKGIEQLWNWYQKGFEGFAPSGHERYSRKALTQMMGQHLDKMLV